MKIYELLCEISPSLSEEEIKALVLKISEEIISLEGKLERTSEPLKKKLGIPFNKFKEAFLVDFVFQVNPDKIGQLNKVLKSKSDILRYMLLSKKHLSDETQRSFIRRRKIEKSIEPKEFEIEKKQEEGEETKSHKPKKVELQEIDQKIEEILSE